MTTDASKGFEMTDYTIGADGSSVAVEITGVAGREAELLPVPDGECVEWMRREIGQLALEEVEQPPPDERRGADPQGAVVNEGGGESGAPGPYARHEQRDQDREGHEDAVPPDLDPAERERDGIAPDAERRGWARRAHIDTIRPKLMTMTASAMPALIQGELARFQRPSSPRTRLLETAPSKISSGAMNAML